MTCNERLAAASAIQEWLEEYKVSPQDRGFYFSLWLEYTENGATPEEALNYVYPAITAYNVIRLPEMARSAKQRRLFTPTWVQVICWFTLALMALYYVMRG